MKINDERKRFFFIWKIAVFFILLCFIGSGCLQERSIPIDDDDGDKRYKHGDIWWWWFEKREKILLAATVYQMEMMVINGDVNLEIIMSSSHTC